MKAVTAQMIKQLRDRTGVGMGKCKEALQEANGDIDLAIDNLRKAGIASAVKKAGRETNEGMICFAENTQTLSLIEVNAETDFVVKNARFQEFANSLAQEVCDSLPTNLSDFLQQTFSKDPELTIDQYRATLVQELGENIQVRRIEIFPKQADATLAVYLHAGGKLATVVEIMGAVGLDILAKDLAMHVAAEAPEYLSSTEVPERVLEHEKEIARAQIADKPQHIIDKILAGKLQAYFDQVCLLQQKFVKDPNITIQELIDKKSRENNQSLRISQFLRWHVGS